MSDVLSLKADWWSEGLGFNLWVVAFPNVCVPNFELESFTVGVVGVGQRMVEGG